MPQSPDNLYQPSQSTLLLALSSAVQHKDLCHPDAVSPSMLENRKKIDAIVTSGTSVSTLQAVLAPAALAGNVYFIKRYFKQYRNLPLINGHIESIFIHAILGKHLPMISWLVIYMSRKLENLPLTCYKKILATLEHLATQDSFVGEVALEYFTAASDNFNNYINAKAMDDHIKLNNPKMATTATIASPLPPVYSPPRNEEKEEAVVVAPQRKQPRIFLFSALQINRSKRNADSIYVSEIQPTIRLASASELVARLFKSSTQTHSAPVTPQSEKIDSSAFEGSKTPR